MKICLISANLGDFERNFVENGSQSVKIDTFRFTDENFLPRDKSMTPRLQARIPKMFGWQMVPNYDIYIWVDGSCALLNTDSVKWLVEKLGDADIALLRHPNRKSIQQEADYLKERLTHDNQYIIPRYKNELIDEQLAEIHADKDFIDDKLFASTVMIYRNNARVRAMMKEWWYHTSRYHSIDQLSLPYAIFKSGCRINVIRESYMKTPYITYTRASKRKPK